MSENYITSNVIIIHHTVYKNGEQVFANTDADLSAFLLSVYKFLDLTYTRFYKMDNLSKLGWLASEILLRPGFQKENYTPEEIGLVLSNANASLDTDQKYLATTKDIASPSVFVYTLPNIVTGEICIRNNFKGEDAFFVSDSFNAAFIQNYVSILLDKNNLQACICGWVELLENNYKAVLFLVEKIKNKDSMLFTTENMLTIFDIKPLRK